MTVRTQAVRLLSSQQLINHRLPSLPSFLPSLFFFFLQVSSVRLCGRGIGKYLDSSHFVKLQKKKKRNAVCTNAFLFRKNRFCTLGSQRLFVPSFQVYPLGFHSLSGKNASIDSQVLQIELTKRSLK